MNFYTHIDGIENLINESIYVKLETHNVKKNYRFLPGRKHFLLQMIYLNGRRNHVNIVFFARASYYLPGKNVWKFKTMLILLLISNNSSL